MSAMHTLFIAALLATQSGSASTHRVRISVFDPAEVGLPTVVFLHGSSQDNSADRVLRTDSQGRLLLDLDSGYYDLCFAVSGFTPACREVRLDSRDVSIRVVLKVSKLNISDFE